VATIAVLLQDWQYMVLIIRSLTKESGWKEEEKDFAEFHIERAIND
jgi:hypothetical protein